jgi:hypothetical protein
VKIEVIVGLGATAPGALTSGAEVSGGTGVAVLSMDPLCIVAVGISIPVWLRGTFQPAAEAITIMEIRKTAVINNMRRGL